MLSCLTLLRKAQTVTFRKLDRNTATTWNTTLIITLNVSIYFLKTRWKFRMQISSNSLYFKSNDVNLSVVTSCKSQAHNWLIQFWNWPMAKSYFIKTITMTRIENFPNLIFCLNFCENVNISKYFHTAGNSRVCAKEIRLFLLALPSYIWIYLGVHCINILIFNCSIRIYKRKYFDMCYLFWYCMICSFEILIKLEYHCLNIMELFARKEKLLQDLIIVLHVKVSLFHWHKSCSFNGENRHA